MKKWSVIIILGSFLIGNTLHAAVIFSNTSSTAVGYQQTIGRDDSAACPTGQYQFNSFVFSTSTQQIEFTTAEFGMQTYDSASGTGNFVQAVGLRVTNQNTTEVWNATNFVFGTETYPAYWVFTGAGNPYAAANETLLFEFSDPSTLPAPGVGQFTQVQLKTVVNTETPQVSSFTENREGCDDFPLPTGTYGVPKMRLYGSAIDQDIIPILPPTSTSITTKCPDFGFFTPFCDAAIWFFVPDTSALATQASYAKNLIATKFPFSYVASLNTAMTSAMASATGTEPLLTIDLSGTVSSGTAFGNFMPSTITMFSTSTVRTYAPDAAWTVFRTLMELAVYFGTAEMIYFGALHLLKPET